MNIFLISLGCDKNLCDSEVMLGLLARAGHIIVDNEDLADVIIINSCSFIGDAQEESINTIIEAGKYKTEGYLKYLIVTGCLSQRFSEEIKEQLPEVDAIIGTKSFHKITDVIERLEENSLKGIKETICILDEINSPLVYGSPRLLSTGGHFAYMKIAEGCNKNCSYCIIPSLRGKYMSVPVETLLGEAAALARDGVKELILVAQETTLYGKDLYGRKMLPVLLKKLSEIEGLEWIRILYCYPEEITDELIDAVASLPKVVKYLDIPIQSASDNVLRRMGRLTNVNELKELITKLRDRVPGIALRTTFISGFPGETEEDHEATLDFISWAKFERLGVFTYSREEDTSAAKMSDQIDEDVKRDRRDEIMGLQQSICRMNSEKMIGKDVEAFVEGKLTTEKDMYVGRTYRDAPDVDGYIFINCDYELVSGDIVKCRVTDANEYDLIGDILNESAE